MLRLDIGRLVPQPGRSRAELVAQRILRFQVRAHLKWVKHLEFSLSDHPGIARVSDCSSYDANMRQFGADVAFGRSEGGSRPFEDRGLVRRLVRLEPLGLLVLDDHPLAHEVSIPSEKLAGTEIDISAGSEAVPEWIDLGERSLESIDARSSPPHEPAIGVEETARHLRSRGRPILAMTSSPPVDGAVLVPIREPVPLYPWAVMHHRDLEHAGLVHLEDAIDMAASEWHWLERPPDSWIPTADTAVFDLEALVARPP